MLILERPVNGKEDVFTLRSLSVFIPNAPPNREKHFGGVVLFFDAVEQWCNGEMVLRVIVVSSERK